MTLYMIDLWVAKRNRGRRNNWEERKILTMNVEEEVGRLQEEIKRLGQVQDDGSYQVHSSLQSLSRSKCQSSVFP